jgi:CDP-glucose 4,6-dehydratase
MPSFWDRRPVFVTGATGFLGSHLVDALVELGAWVVVLQRDERPATPVVARWLDRVARVRGDVGDTALIERVLEEYQVRTVLHVAAQTQVGVARRLPAATFAVNVGGTWSVLEAVRRSPSVEQVVLASSDKAYGAQDRLPYAEDMELVAEEPYDASKAAAELMARSYWSTYGTPVAITRCANLYGPGDRNWRRIVPGTLRHGLLGERPVIRSDGSPVRDYLYVKDGAGAYLRLAEAMAVDASLAGQAFNFSAEEPISVRAMVARIQQAAGTDLEPLIANDAVGEIPAQHVSARMARDVLGWAREYGIDEGLREAVVYYRGMLGLEPAARQA